jgi:hypothetical protein
MANMSHLYISGPMTGIVDFNFAAFNRAARLLRDAGYQVTNPAELNPKGRTWAECLRVDLKAMLDCDALATLDQCEGSRGARMECQVAHLLMMPVRPWLDWLGDLIPEPRA